MFSYPFMRLQITKLNVKSTNSDYKYYKNTITYLNHTDVNYNCDIYTAHFMMMYTYIATWHTPDVYKRQRYAHGYRHTLCASDKHRCV